MEQPEPINLTSTAPGSTAPWAQICPYLLDASGTWRATSPSGEHRCTAVAPPVPLGTEKQRQLCLVAEHLDCPTYLAAREIRARTLGDAGPLARATAPRRTYPRTVPVILERPAPAVVAFSTLRTSLPQVGLVVLMLLAAAALVFARFATP